MGVAVSVGAALLRNAVGMVYDAKGSAFAWTAVIIFGAVEILLLMVMKKMDKKEYSELYRQ